jgi:hypothetical protein
VAGECHSNTGGMPNTIFVWQGFPRARELEARRHRGRSQQRRGGAKHNFCLARFPELEARRQGTSQQDRGGGGCGGRTSFFESCTLQDPPNNISCQIYSHIGPGLVTNKSLKYGRAAAFTSGLRPAVIQSCGAIAAAGGCVTSFQFHGSSH